MTTKFAAALSTLLLTSAMAIAADDASQGRYRKWTDASGKFELEAEFVGVSCDQDKKPTSVTLKKRDGTVLNVELTRLSADSRRLALQLNASQSHEEAEPVKQIKPEGMAIATESPVPVFDIHFCVITRNPGTHRAATLEQLKKEVDILNSFFVTKSRQPIVRFRFKSAHLYQEVADLKCGFVELGDGAVPYDTDDWARRFNECPHPQVRDPQAINFYVYDCYGTNGAADQTSHGKRNSNRPYVLIDWQRLNHSTQGAEEHEMGHAFGLEHVHVPGATVRTHTNIMASIHAGGSGGLRDIGFDTEQVRTILHHAAITYQKLYGKPMPTAPRGPSP